MNVLHTEASTGWGGQEIRILEEAKGMRERGHQMVMAIAPGGKLVAHARNAGFTVYEVPFSYRKALQVLRMLRTIVRRHQIHLINTHSSLDAWLGGLAARFSGRAVIRTRHVSCPIRKGINSHLLYNWLADYTLTTSEKTAAMIRSQARLAGARCFSVPTGIHPERFQFPSAEVERFRKQWQLAKGDFLVGTACVLRSWKGISDLLKAAAKLKDVSNLKWMIVGEGPGFKLYQRQALELGIEDKVIFTGYLNPPYIAMAAMEAFLLLSTANEGVSQAVLQAAYLKKPLITTSVGGLDEICLHQKTGLLVECFSPDQVAKAVEALMANQVLRNILGQQAHALVLKQFTMSQTLDTVEQTCLAAVQKIC